MKGFASMEAIFAISAAIILITFTIPLIEDYKVRTQAVVIENNAKSIALDITYIINFMNVTDQNGSVRLKYVCLRSEMGCLEYTIRYNQGLELNYGSGKVLVPSLIFNGSKHMKPGTNVIIISVDGEVSIR